MGIIGMVHRLNLTTLNTRSGVLITDGKLQRSIPHKNILSADFLGVR